MLSFWHEKTQTSRPIIPLLPCPLSADLIILHSRTAGVTQPAGVTQVSPIRPERRQARQLTQQGPVKPGIPGVRSGARVNSETLLPI